ncbi:hypothetical protein BDQ17DRAFT_1250313 [Cyathus striatus]|nr:hypothetical protein BDQ17DRAFT_1250313 [Cyathus striatus]
MKASEQSSVAPKHYSHLLAGVLNTICGISWTIAYVLYVFQARKDNSYGMPLTALIFNVTWEFVYTFIYRLNGIGRYVHFPWVFLDAFLVSETLKHAPKEWAETSPLVANHFSTFFSIASLLALTAQWTFAHQFSRTNASFWSAYVCQNILSWGSIWMLLARGNGSGHSMEIWWCRFIGSLAANLRYLYRVNVWPQKYGFLSGAFSVWILWMPCLADLLYPFVYQFVTENRETYFAVINNVTYVGAI